MARYLADRGFKALDAQERDKLLYWYVHTFLWGRYAGSTETVLNRDLQILERDGVDGLIEEIRSSRGDLRVRPNDFVAWSRGARFYPLLYMLTRVNHARDWGNGLELHHQLLGYQSALELHHIFPKARLYAAGYSQSEVNSLANFAFLTMETNLEVTDKLPRGVFRRSTRRSIPERDRIALDPRRPRAVAPRALSRTSSPLVASSSRARGERIPRQPRRRNRRRVRGGGARARRGGGRLTSTRSSRGQHAKIDRLVARIRQENSAAAPDVDPDGPGQGARVLMVARDPGEKGALVTGVLSPTKNPDATARNMVRLMREAGLPEDICLFWNAVPWALGGRRSPRADELRRGIAYLTELVALLPELRAVVALGRDAEVACRMAGLDAIGVCHPSPLGLYGGGANRWAAHREGLIRAAALAK